MPQARRNKRKQPKESIVPVDSFSDIAFLLIIFFILATQFIDTRGFDTEIPAGQEGDDQQKQTVTVALNNEQLHYNDDQLEDVSELEERLLKLDLKSRKNEEDRIVILEPSGHVTYQLFYETMYTISRCGGVVAIMQEEE